MEQYYKVNYEIIQEAFLNAESKDQLNEIFMASTTGKLTTDLISVKAGNLPECLKKIPQSL